MRFRYSDNGACGFVRDSENDKIILHGNGEESRKFLKMAAILINKEFEDNMFDENGEQLDIQIFEEYYDNILKENI